MGRSPTPGVSAQGSTPAGSSSGSPAPPSPKRPPHTVLLDDDQAAPSPVTPTRSRRGLKPAASTRLLVKGEVAEVPPEEFVGCCGSQAHHMLVMRMRTIRDDIRFVVFFIIAILFSGALVGLTLYDSVTSMEGFDTFNLAAEWTVAVLFTAEVAFKIGAEGNQPFEFFKDAWNLFDFLVVLLQYMPVDSAAVSIVRLIRVARVLRLVRALPKLRVLVMGLAQALSSIGYIALLLGLLYYCFAVLAVSLYAKNDPIGMGTLHVAFLTLFQAGTLEDWTDIMYTQIEGCEVYGYEGRQDQCIWSDPQPMVSTAFFLAFTILANLLVLNLFIGVILITMDEAQFKLNEELRLEREQLESKLHSLRKEDDPGKRDEHTVRIDLAMRERLSNISAHLAVALSGLNDVYAHHAEVEATRLVWTWAASARQTSAAVKNLGTLRRLRTKQLVRTLAPGGGTVAPEALMVPEDADGGFLPTRAGTAGHARRLSSITTKLRTVRALHSLVDEPGTGQGAPPPVSPLGTITEGDGASGPEAGSGDAKGSPAAPADNPLAQSDTPTKPPLRPGPPPKKPSAWAAISARSRGALSRKLPTRAADDRVSLSDAGVDFDMEVGRAAARSLIKPQWYNALNTAARRRSVVGRVGGGVKSLSRVLSEKSLAALASPSARDTSVESGGSALSVGSGVSAGDSMHLAGGGVGAFTTPGHALADVLAAPSQAHTRAGAPPPIRLEVDNSNHSSFASPPGQAEEAGDSKTVSPAQRHPLSPGVRPVADSPGNSPATGVPATPASTRRRSMAAVARFSAVVSAAAGVKKIQQSFRARKAASGGAAASPSATPSPVSVFGGDGASGPLASPASTASSPSLRSPEALSAATRAYIAASERVEVVAARAAVAASLESLPPVFAQFGRGIDSVARRLLERARRKSSRALGSASRKVTRARTKLEVMAALRMGSSRHLTGAGEEEGGAAPATPAKITPERSLTHLSAASTGTGASGSDGGSSPSSGPSRLFAPVGSGSRALGSVDGDASTRGVSDVGGEAAGRAVSMRGGSPGPGGSAAASRLPPAFTRLSQSQLITAAARECIMAKAGLALPGASPGGAGASEGTGRPPEHPQARGRSHSGVERSSSMAYTSGSSFDGDASSMGSAPAPLLSPTTVNAARVTTLMSALAKLDATQNALEAAQTPR